jgi:hypothetical protein
MSPAFLRRKDVNSLLRSASFEGKLPYASREETDSNPS